MDRIPRPIAGVVNPGAQDHANRARIAPVSRQYRASIAPVSRPYRARIAPVSRPYRARIAPVSRQYRYERSTHQYIKVKKSLEQPDPIRLRYREQVYEKVGAVVRQLRVQAREHVTAYAAKHVEERDQERFISIVTDDLRRLHEGVIARYRLRPSELAAWRAAIRSEVGE
jgi:hypothetical protein